MGLIGDSRREIASNYDRHAIGYASALINALFSKLTLAGLSASLIDLYIVPDLALEVPEIAMEGMDTWDYARAAFVLASAPVIWMSVLNILFPIKHYRDSVQSAQSWRERAENADRLGL